MVHEPGLSHAEIVAWLRQTDPERIASLWARADAVRQAAVGDEVHLRGLVEFTNHCARNCHYCGLRAANRAVHRYRLSADEILACAHQAVAFGYGTLVLQSGEDPGTGAEWLADVVRRVKAETPLAVTLSVGERTGEELRLWRQAGADRYLLRFETSNARLYAAIHPDRAGRKSDRLAILRQLRDLGYEVGSGAMVGIPGQSFDDVARDIEVYAELDLDMIGIGPFLPHPDTPLGAAGAEMPILTEDQAPNTAEMAYKAIALTRILCPTANIPSTTALATLNPAMGRELGLRRGANVVMPNLTPPQVRKEYIIYPGKACATENAEHCSECMSLRIASIGRRVGTGRGDSLAHRERTMPRDEQGSESAADETE